MDLKAPLDEHYDYAMKEIASLWNVSREWVRRRFTNEPGVIRLQEAPTPGKRTYCPLRIPGHVAIRVRNRMTVVQSRLN
jgi:hypothetical protein